MKKRIFMASIFCFIALIFASCKSKKDDGNDQTNAPECWS